MKNKMINGLLLSGALAMAAQAQEADVYQELERLGQVIDQIQNDYVEEIDTKTLIDAAISGMLTSLDPHSSYLNEDAFADMQESTSGEFGGLGIEVTQEEGLVKVVSPIDDTPAALAGVEAGDYISHVDGESLIGLTLDEAVTKLRGPLGSTVKITIIRQGETEPFDLEITRETITVRSSKVRLVGDTAVIRLTSFDEQTYPSMMKGLQDVFNEAGGQENISGYVIDLRNNPGGLLTTAIEISDAFLDAGEIVSTRGRHERDSGREMATKGDVTNGAPLVVLINRGSASASEIVAGALQDHHRAVVVGTASFGKGSVQSIIPLDQTHAIRMTTARYYTPSGRSIQGFGVEPDVFIEAKPRPRTTEEPKSEAFQDFGEDDLKGALKNDSFSEEEIQLLEQERLERNEQLELREEDIQLSYAIDIIHSLGVFREK